VGRHNRRTIVVKSTAREDVFVSEAKETSLQTGVALWNPNAAASWSLLFTPAFGAHLHALNWRALGEHDRARASTKWFYVGLGLLPLYFLLGVLDGDIALLAGIIHVLAWYFSSARVQAKYVEERYGAFFPRKPWGTYLLIATGGMVGYFALGFLVTLFWTWIVFSSSSV